MKISRLLITIGLTLSTFGTVTLLFNGVYSIIGIVLLVISYYIYYKLKDIKSFSTGFIIIGAAYLVMGLLNSTISIDGLFYLIGGFLALSSKK